LEIKAPAVDMVLAFSNAIDMISPLIVNHHKRVAYISYKIATELGLPRDRKNNLLLASLLHDCGALHYRERLNLLKFDFSSSTNERNSHAYRGWLLLKNSKFLRVAAEIIKHHHIYWNGVDTLDECNKKVPIESYILHLADRIDILLQKDKDILSQVSIIEKTIISLPEKIFVPEIVEAYINVSKNDYFWFDLTTPFLDSIIKSSISMDLEILDEKEIISICQILHEIIDLRSSYTANHSTSVANFAMLLSKKFKFEEKMSERIYIAGLLHDLGKLSVPSEILNKTGSLTNEEYNIIKKHTYFTYRILETIPNFQIISNWASYHHEKLDGSGYPFGVGSNILDLGSRIISVSDVFSALTEDRPYRDRLSIKTSFNILDEMVKLNYLDGDVVSEIKKHEDELNELIVSCISTI
jgi:HD-GYP domain-containing protein (c-di-GMP phosphodiesterase class II)